MSRLLGDYIGNPAEVDVLPHKKLIDGGMTAPIGLEFEVEDYDNNPFYSTKYWDMVADNSLRHDGMELVLKKPLKGNALVNAISELYDHGMDEWSLSVRCSTHVHVDCRMLNVKQLILFYLLLLEYDEEFYRISDSEHRRQSPFAVMCWNNYNVIQGLKQLLNIETSELTINLLVDAINMSAKYRSINTTALRKFGSIELRHSRCIDEEETLYLYINLALTLHNKVMSIPKSKLENSSVLDLFKEESTHKNGKLIHIALGGV